ncbi:ATP-dependent DNA ligase domain-containing protein [Toxoplasma gondii FOU]|uniref:ATP-dependent DNA ligase domain-containing protein n=1 Tax=Toxoplasma gondii FOU TaxID=943167 RepID=A0A086KS16_TOXGO|nr:ATP-dependent DNA ligase domain-containing protein [Toxoplasma gondii FOU]
MYIYWYTFQTRSGMCVVLERTLKRISFFPVVRGVFFVAQVFALPPAAAARLKLYKDPAAATASAGGRPLAARAGDFASCVAASVQERAGRRQPSVTVVRGIFFDLGLLCLLVNSLKAYLIQVVSDPPGKIGKVKSRARGEFRVTFPHIQ